ncbi:MAG: hypothetical protein AVDCRST_MAG64-2281 [uncultured Phycisphaerae bacterium]|uniref:Uncharacterized protein n=1 Tax=uncultured Phycisphaerae bacterium TaxID=904963 RepID=A0A6J4PAC3_9BACT|nr:MAG: hypothetical protein AVDCRST_MAG64-2281 [uncultured Phycisphaerae bacterium]
MRSSTSPPSRSPTLAELHEHACREGRPTYTDPATGYEVFTAVHLRDRGACCGSGCRHCPYPHEAEDVAAEANRVDAVKD